MAKKKKKLGALILGNAKKSADTKKNAKKKTTAVSKTKKVANTPAKPLQKTAQQVKTATQKSAQKMATLSKQTEEAAKKSAAEKKQKKTEEKKKQAAVVQARKESQSARVAAIKNSAGKTQSHKKGGAELAQKEVAKRPVVLGVSNAMNIAPVDWDEGFTDEAKKIAKETKEKTSYKVAYGAGTAASFLVPGAASKGVSNALLKGGKNASKVEKFIADRAADTIVSTPLNVKEAIKTGREGEDGFDAKAAAKSLAVNTGLDLAIGGGIDAGAAILKKKNSNKIIKIMAKQKSGAKLTDAETKFYNKEMAKIKSENVANAEKKAVEEVQAKYEAQKDNKKTAPELVNMADAPHPTSKTFDPSAVSSNIDNGVSPVNKVDTENKGTVGVTSSNDNAVNLSTEAKVDDAYKAMSEDAYNYPGKQYDNAAEKAKGDNPSPKDAVKNSKIIDPAEVPHVKQTAVKLSNQANDDVSEIMEPWIREGLMDKKVFEKQADAVTRAEGELADGRLYKNFMESSVTDNEHLFMARAKVLLEDLTKRAPSDNAAAEELLHVMDKATEASSHAGRLLNATKLLLRNTPQGRLRMIQKEVDSLNNKFSDRFKGKGIELTDDQITRILKATDDDIEEVAEKINREIWDKIPASGFEKFNEFRHASMLFNPKTHIRNLTGNFVFKLGREMSNAIEVAAYHIPAVKKRVENLGGKVEMVHVPKSEIKAHKEVLDEIFAKNYKNAESKNRYIESARPDGAPIIKNRAINKVVQTNYGLLEKEDMLMFKPEYRKNFARWCKANNVPLDKISEMSKKQMAKANNFAMKQAEIATFRDNSAFANKIIGLKQKTATKKGKTIIGTTGYRAANVVLESNLPFVKTPVNILKRSADYSPVGLGRSFIELATAKSADDFMQGVHHLSTGLTGTGICALGMWLANNDLITVRAGEESGDAYYDRDMGYQDWSLVVADGKYSVTIDWLSPLQTSLFMGATMWNNIEDKSLTLEDGFECLMAITGPMLDMSFMSTSKDTIETFMEKVYRNGTGDDADWSGAIMQTLLGSIPQGYLNSFVPQILTQTAQAFDSKQRDTRSTKESSVAASWDSWSKKIINKIPGLRNYLLNPKLDRFGEDVETGNNVVLRFINAYMNPSNVKEINMTELDKVIIEIYNNLEDENQKKYYYYNFTGNPSYDLGDGKRMSYDELYAYGKEKRREQTKLIQRMADSASFEFMTWAMKGDEVSDAHWISQTQADFKTYGADYAVEKIVGGNETEKEKHTLFKRYGGDNEDFVSFYLEKEKLVARAHDTSNYTKAMAIAVFDNDKIAKTYGVYGDKLKAAKKYLDSGGTVDAFADTTCRVVSVIKSADVSNSIKNKAVAAAIIGVTLSGEMYNAMGMDSDVANMGHGLMSMGYSFDALEQMKADALFEFDADNNNGLKKSEIVSYINSLGLDSQEEKACLFRYFSDAKNPYGNVPNYLGLSSGSYGSSGGSGSGKGKADDSDLPAWEDYVKDFISNSEKVAGVNFKDWDSPLDSSYRKKIQSILDDSRVS